MACLCFTVDLFADEPIQILTTAIFTVLMLGRPLTPKRWIALIILTIGVSIVSIPSADSKDPSFIFQDMADHFFPRSVHELGQVTTGMGEVADHLTRRSATYEGIEDDQNLVPTMNYSIGLSAVLVAAVVSGLTGVYFEKVVKDPATSVSIWTRNIQLSFYSLFPALLVGIVYKDGEEIAQHGFFDGYNWVVWTLITLQACGGILASLCINYADNIAKNFATSISIIISFLFSVCFFDVKVTWTVRSKKTPPVSLARQALLIACVSSSSWAHFSSFTQLSCIPDRIASVAGHRQSALPASRRRQSSR